MAFSNAGLGAEHALAHSLGGMFDTLHGLVHPILLPPVMRFNLPACVDKMAVIGEMLLGATAGSPEKTALAGIERLREFCVDLGASVQLRDIVNDRSQIPELCKMAANDVCLLTNPREAAWTDLVDICEEAW